MFWQDIPTVLEQATINLAEPVLLTMLFSLSIPEIVVLFKNLIYGIVFISALYQIYSNINQNVLSEPEKVKIIIFEDHMINKDE